MDLQLLDHKERRKYTVKVTGKAHLLLTQFGRELTVLEGDNIKSVN